MTEDTLDPELLEAVAPETTGRRLFEIRLPERDHGSINISSWRTNGSALNLDPREWLDQGYAGVLIVGVGTSPTHILSNLGDGRGLYVSRHPGVVRLETVHVHSGYAEAVHFGEANPGRTIVPRFRLEMIGCQASVPPPTAFGRSKWCLFGYQSDLWLEDVVLDAYHAAEHASYWHGFARHGLYWKRVTIEGSGAEGCKVRSPYTETGWPGPRARIQLIDCLFKNWHQTWTDRGGAAVVVQGGAADISVLGCVFRGGSALPGIPANRRSRAIMISSENVSYGIDGTPDVGPGNGRVVIRRCAVSGGPGAEDWNNSELIRVQRNSGSQPAARSVLIEGCGLWGLREHVSVGEITGRFLLQGCNTQEAREACNGIGMDTEHEASILGGGRIIPCSEGYDSRPDVIE
jgi:hypothetical protein